MFVHSSRGTSYITLENWNNAFPPCVAIIIRAKIEQKCENVMIALNDSSI